jgi:hypothetical protein
MLRSYASLPEHPFYAAVVTLTTALLSDCSATLRLTLADGWQAMGGDPLIPDPASDYVLLPRTLEHLASRIRRHYKEPLFPLRQQRRHRPGRPQRGCARGGPLHRARPGLRDPASRSERGRR